ncbi:MAG: type II toxin-antitoxin system VapC family toxin [Devosia sp.]|nr:type II toxin-antitoxin system VapC family toxin [Devosia sp.]
MIVADASIILAWAYGEPNAHLATPVLRRIARDGAVVPPIWPMEIANSLELSVLRKRISIVQSDELRADIRQLAIRIEELSVQRIWDDVSALSRMHGLTIYDASYLELAVRQQLPLASFDQQLADAARAAGVPVLP